MEDITGRRNYGQEFEDEVKTFLEDTMKLSDVRGGPDFHIAPEGESNQIDACGRCDDVLFVFECKASGKKIKKDIRRDILATASKAKMAFENYKKIPEYSKCKIFKFILITKKIEVSDVQKESCRSLHMYYEDNHLLEYYKELHDKIGIYATYNFLADFGIYPSERESLVVTALRARLGKYVVYSFFARPKQLLKFAYVARRRVGREDFYQRMLDTSRIRNIQRFLDSGGVFPTNVIVSFKNAKTQFKKIAQISPKESQVGVLTVGGSYSACWIIDGQHRLYSYSRSLSNEYVSCLAFEEIPIEDERGFFLEINREQRPIQPDLLWDLEGLSNPNGYRGMISNIVRTLNKIETAPFFYKIYIPLYGTKEDKIINMAAFCNGLVNAALAREIAPNFIGMANPLALGAPATVTKRIAVVLGKYFELLNTELSDEHKDFVFGNAGVPVLLYLLEPIVAHVKKVPNEDDLREYAQCISAYFKLHYPMAGDIRKLKRELNSEGARKDFARRIGMFIRKEKRDSNFWPEMEQDEFVENIISMERRVGSLIASQLSKATTGWEKQRVPQAIYLKARSRMEEDGTPFEENLTLGDECTIILQSNNWAEIFKVIFLGKNGFTNPEEVKLAFSYLSKIRNPVLHGKSVAHSKEDLDQCEIYLKRLEKVIPETITSEIPDSSI